MTLDASDQGSGSFPRGIHPQPMKELASEQAITVLPTPAQLRVPVLQHIGAPAKLVVKPRTEVEAGQLLAEPGGFVSAGCHAPLAGKAMKPGNVTLSNGRHILAVPVKVGEENLAGQALYDAVLGGEWPTEQILAQPDDYRGDAVLTCIRDAGLVGMGGAAFPTHVKLAPNAAKPVDTILVNGCECEPYLTSDDRVMREAPRAVVCGALIAALCAGARRVVIGVEAPKTEAIAALQQAISGLDGSAVALSVQSLAAKYPMGGEKQTVRAALGRIVPNGGLPLDAGVVVINVGTCTGIAGAVLRGRPFTHRVVTVTGRGVAKPGNILAPIGAPISELIALCGGLTPEAERVICGGPMMGFTLGDLDTPVTKGTSGITVLSHADVRKAEETNCIRCGRCVDVCPLNLVPTKIALASRHKNWELAQRYHIKSCMECGCCTYTCPASLPLVQMIRVGKACMPKG